MNRFIAYIFSAVMVLLASSCESNGYDTGDNGYATFRSDYADIHVVNNQVQSIVTDDDVSLKFNDGLVLQTAKADTTVRRVMYYNFRSTNEPVNIVSMGEVRMMTPIDKSKVKTMKTDPLYLEAAWMGRNGKFVNLTLGLMIGNASSSEAYHTVSLVRTSVSNEGKGCVNYTLYHDQGDIPQYYTAKAYFSVVPPALQDTMKITVNTYAGTVTRVLVKP